MRRIFWQSNVKKLRRASRVQFSHEDRCVGGTVLGSVRQRHAASERLLRRNGRQCHQCSTGSRLLRPAANGRETRLRRYRLLDGLVYWSIRQGMSAQSLLRIFFHWSKPVSSIHRHCNAVLVKEVYMYVVVMCVVSNACLYRRRLP